MEEHLAGVLDAACAFPVSWGHFGAGDATPRAAVFRIGAATSRTLDGPGPTQTRLQIDVYAQTFGAVLAAGREIEAALDGYTGGPVLGAFLDSRRDGAATDVGVLRRVSLTFLVTHRD